MLWPGMPFVAYTGYNVISARYRSFKADAYLESPIAVEIKVRGTGVMDTVTGNVSSPASWQWFLVHMHRFLIC